MGNLKFVKSSIGYCIYLDDNLFNDCGTKFETIMAVMELFSFEKMSVKSEQYADDSERFFGDIIKNIDCKTNILIQRHGFFKKTCSKVEILFNGGELNKFIEVAIKQDVTFEADCYDKNDICMQLLINGNDGSCIHFNDKKFDISKISEQIKEILKINF
ncbi:MAG: hypothetical protein OSJ67_06850 [Clostridia bacterium]|nr:hypothetical protein [Clostridia bacterium]